MEEALRMLSHRGITLSLDDFGMGYCSLGYLAWLPVDNIEIDLSFVRGMMERAESMRLVKAMVELARLLDMGMVAEGMESQAQKAALVEIDSPPIG